MLVFVSTALSDSGQTFLRSTMMICDDISVVICNGGESSQFEGSKPYRGPTVLQLMMSRVINRRSNPNPSATKFHAFHEFAFGKQT